MQPSRTPAGQRLCTLPRVSLLLALAVLLGPIDSGAAAASLSLTSSVISEGDDFATRVLGLPWDMGTGPYPDFATVFEGVDRASFSQAGGIWSFTTTSDDPWRVLLWHGI